MSQTKKLTLSAILVALGVVVMYFGSVIEVIDLTVCAFASLLVVFVYLEVGMGYAFGVYFASAIISFLVLPTKLVFFEYTLVFGIYPMVKAFIEKLPRKLWLVVKLVYVNIIIWLLVLVFEFFVGTAFIEGDTPIFKIAFYLLLNLAFLAYDYFVTVMVKYYYENLRKKIKRFLK